MSKNIQINKHWRVRRLDATNWTLSNYREVTDKEGNTKMKWMPCNLYFYRFSDAVKYIFDHSIDTDAKDAKSVINALKKISKELVEACKEIDLCENTQQTNEQ